MAVAIITVVAVERHKAISGNMVSFNVDTNVTLSSLPLSNVLNLNQRMLMENPNVNTNNVLKSRTRVNENGVREIKKGKGRKRGKGSRR